MAYKARSLCRNNLALVAPGTKPDVGELTFRVAELLDRLPTMFANTSRAEVRMFAFENGKLVSAMLPVLCAGVPNTIRWLIPASLNVSANIC